MPPYSSPRASSRNSIIVPKRRWRIAVLLGLGVLINYFDRVNVSVAKDALHSDFGVTTVMFGYILSAYNWTYALLQLPMGVVLDRFGVRNVGRASTLLWSIATFAATAAIGVKSFIFSRLLLGVGEAPTFPAYAKAVGYWFPREERSLATAMFDAAAKFGPAIGTPLVGLLLIHFGWRWSFAATAILSFLYFLVFYVVYRDPGEDPNLSEAERRYLAEHGATERATPGVSGGASLAYLLKQRKVWGLVLGFFGYNYCFYLLLTWMPTYFSTLHLTPTESVLWTSVPWLVATLTDLLVGGWMVDVLVKRGHDDTRVRKTVLIVGTALGLGIAGAMFTTSVAVAVFWISISIGGLAAAAPVGWSLPGLIAPRDSVGKVGGILNFGNQVAGITAPIVTGYLVGPRNSFGAAFAVTAAILLVGIAAYVFLLGRVEPVPEP
ncbi:MAG TPA: MFS transporter [Bryobacteraceae bacterium]|nr:MFS transporter [Bryobacteraceae bacterium]